jgi:glycosyltransferase involved in cell wall biosynthesis
MLKGETIVCISSIDWDEPWQLHQEVMSRLAASGNRVLFLENTGVRAPTLRDLPRLRQRLRNWLSGSYGFRRDRVDLFVYSPLILPFPYSHLIRRVNGILLARSVKQWLRGVSVSHPLVISFLPTPALQDLIGELAPELTVYFLVDDLRTSSPAAQRIGRWEAEMIRRADLVIVSAEKLRARASGLRPDVHLIPSGVDYSKFERARLRRDPAPPDISALPQPIIGYVGGVNARIDRELLARVATDLPHASFVLIGPASAHASELVRRRNIYILGPRVHDDLPRYIGAFAVGIIPYRLTEFSSHIYPAKLNEYLAMGIPVVATDLAEVRRFNVEHGNLVMVAADAAGFALAIVKALQPAAPAAVTRRVEVSRLNSWDARMAQITALVQSELARRRAIGNRPSPRFPTEGQGPSPGRVPLPDPTDPSDNSRPAAHLKGATPLAPVRHLRYPPGSDPAPLSPPRGV